MSAPLHNEMAAAMEQLRERQKELTAAVGRAQEVSESATSRDRMVKATVNGQGQLTELELKGRRWRDLAPKELSAKIVEAVGEAQRAAAAATHEVMTGLLPPGLDLERLRTSGPDLDGMFASMLKDAEGWLR
ncbi:YbaB/EbfC family nucleoid-associated protein [Actinophytocola xanthii]|uniref:YbaB/EbfC family DNA-binding protein n=1 Tax=Actinophytocola xanthii TaxID=1912961 RepID=A0A1Q8CTG5_9PSEU|nr:YbaB/EbfC family nucleoid-associated protein [Actinophytocola xanthii]OLF17637.1 hypothetical protein BU204_10495 [Actinophytocola xanthii]